MYRWFFIVAFCFQGAAHPIDAVKPLVFQVKTAVSADSPKSSYGSGFVISRQGLILTNYHVVDAVTQERDNYRVFVVDGPISHPAEVLAIDVIHDLALLRVKKRFSAELPLGPPPSYGERIYSLGIPMDLDMSVIEGTYNGVIEQGPYQNIHMSAALNPGMSGGPTLNAKGQVIGVNVSILGNSQNISFAVPVEFARKLYLATKPGTNVVRNRDFYNALIERQLLQAQNALMRDMEDQKAKPLSLPGWQLRKPSDILKCWSRQDTEKKFRYQVTQYFCDLYEASYVRDGALSATYQLSYEVLTNQRLNGWQFFGLVNEQYNLDQNFLALFFKASLDDFFTRYDCVDDRIQSAEGIPVKVNYCVQGLVRFSSLVDAEIKFATLAKTPAVLIGRARLEGFTVENLKKFLKMQLDSIKVR